MKKLPKLTETLFKTSNAETIRQWRDVFTEAHVHVHANRNTWFNSYWPRIVDVLQSAAEVDKVSVLRQVAKELVSLGVYSPKITLNVIEESLLRRLMYEEEFVGDFKVYATRLVGKSYFTRKHGRGRSTVNITVVPMRSRLVIQRRTPKTSLKKQA